MSKHSKWSKVKNYKGAIDAKRAAIFTKLARGITVAAREGGGDPGFNFRLRTAIDSALAANMPKDNIERAVKKGTGEVASENIESILYEGYGPGGVAVLVETITDNRNRTSSNIKHTFSIHGGNMGGAGAVQWMFERKGVIRLEGGAVLSADDELVVIDAGAEDIGYDDGETLITCPPDALMKVKAAVEKAGSAVASAGFEWIAKEKAPQPDEEAKASLEGLFEALDDDEDVNTIYSNLP